MRAQVATLVRAEWLFLLTDVAHLYSANPSTDPAAQPIYEVEDMADLQARCPEVQRLHGPRDAYIKYDLKLNV